jgi:hypothetical protein
MAKTHDCVRCGESCWDDDLYLCDQCGEKVCIKCLAVPGSDNNESECADCPAQVRRTITQLIQENSRSENRATVAEVARDALVEGVWAWARGLTRINAYTTDELREMFTPYFESGDTRGLSPREARTLETLRDTGFEMIDLKAKLAEEVKRGTCDHGTHWDTVCPKCEDANQVIAKLAAGGMQHKLDDLTADNARLRGALEKITTVPRSAVARGLAADALAGQPDRKGVR